VDAHVISSPAVVEWVHNMGNEATTVVLVREVVVRDLTLVVVGWGPDMGDELETAVILMRGVVVENELGLTVIMSLLVTVGVELLDMTSIVPDGDVQKEIQ